MTPSSENTPPTPDVQPTNTTAYPFEMAVKRQFIAQHYLTVPDPEPPEGEVHSHEYTLVIRLAGPELGPYGYLVDITTVEAALDTIEDRYRDTLLNDLSEFADRNPSVERFARVIGDQIAPALEGHPPEQLTVRVWEDDLAWASHTRTLS